MSYLDQARKIVDSANLEVEVVFGDDGKDRIKMNIDPLVQAIAQALEKAFDEGRATPLETGEPLRYIAGINETDIMNEYERYTCLPMKHKELPTFLYAVQWVLKHPKRIPIAHNNTHYMPSEKEESDAAEQYADLYNKPDISVFDFLAGVAWLRTRIAPSKAAEWPSEDEIEEAVDEYLEHEPGNSYFGFKAGVNWIKWRMSAKGEGK